MSISQEALAALTMSSEGFDARLRRVDHTWETDGQQLEGHCYYLNFRNDDISIDEFVDYIFRQIIYFCLPSGEIAKLRAKYNETQNVAIWVAAIEKAKAMFVKASESELTLGEPGELILHIMLELVLNAPQLVAKMSLKTNSNVPYHGSDAVHVRYNDEAQKLDIIWGESKLYQQLSSAMDDAVTSIKSFNGDGKGDSPRVRDLQIVRDYASVEDEDLEAVLLEYFDPYNDSSNKTIEYYSCLFGFDYSVYNRLDRRGDRDIDEYFVEEYKKRIESAHDLWVNKVANGKIDSMRFIVFMWPFKNVSDLRRRFMSKLGIDA